MEGRRLPLVMAPPKGRGKPPRHLADLDLAGRQDAAKEAGLPGFRAKQLSVHYFERLVDDPEKMTDLPAGQRQELVDTFLPDLMTPISQQEADKGTTRKTLWKLFDGALVESVLMRYTDRATVCISSQAGCGMACPFCATGQGGLERNMSTAEIVHQVVVAARQMASGEIPGGPGRLSNVVFMGMGEPMANYKALMGAVRRLTSPAPEGLGLSARHVTVSTVGLVPRIKQLTEEGIPVTLALSLHAPDDELRNELVPINTRFSVAETVDAAWNYARVTKRRVSIEYAMMRGINDQGWRADMLADVLNSYGDWGWVHVNLIPLNPTPGSQVDRLRPGGRARVRTPPRGQGHLHHRPRHPRPGDRRRLRPARRSVGVLARRLHGRPAQASGAGRCSWPCRPWVRRTSFISDS